MIIVDERTGSCELAPRLRFLGAPVELALMESGDFAFEGYIAGNGGERGAIGVERKTVSDLITCMTDGRYIHHQLSTMLRDYQEVWLVVEGIFWEDETDGCLSYKSGWQQRNTRIQFTAIDKFLLSITRVAGVRIMYTVGHNQTARRVYDLWQHSQKPMEGHSTFTGFRTDATVVETLSTKVPLVRRWAKELPGVGWVKSGGFMDVFESGHQLANAMVPHLGMVKGVSPKMAVKFYREIRGIR